MCPYGLEIDISSPVFPHFWQGNTRQYQDQTWEACSVQRKADPAAANSEFCWMQGPGTKCGHSIGLYALLLSFLTHRMLLFTVSLCVCPPGQNLGISNICERTALHGCVGYVKYIFDVLGLTKSVVIIKYGHLREALLRRSDSLPTTTPARAIWIPHLACAPARM